MKKILFFLALLGGLSWYSNQRDAQSSAPPEISQPVYGEVRIKKPRGDAEIEMVMLVRAVNQNDCTTHIREVERTAASNPQLCPGCSVALSRCTDSLPPRFANMFENKPGHLTYITIAAGSATEREVRVVYYGTTEAEGDAVCELAAGFQQKHTGAVACVRPRT